MDRVNSHESSVTTSEQDTDLADPPQDLDSIRSRQDLYTSRPSSRLGFNRPELLTCPPDAPADSEAIQWSRSLFQSVGIAELRLSSIKQYPLTKMHVTTPMCSSSSDHDDHDDVANRPVPSIGTISAKECPVTHEKEPTSPTPPRKSPSVSRLCFPFVTTSSPRHNKKPPPPPAARHKYSCRSPSLMSPISASRPVPKHQRHSYQQHGYSRTALQHIKWFWLTREEIWEGSTSQSHSIGPYDGISEDVLPNSPTSAQPSTPAAAPCSTPRYDTDTASVYPRRGDISALRDPYSAHIDRCFSGLPIWTINKTLWMHDLHMTTQMREQSSQINADDNDSSDDENEPRNSLSTNFSDDSDTTLVESESEAELSDAFRSGFPALNGDAKTKNRPNEMQGRKFGSSLATIYATHSPPQRFTGQSAPTKAHSSRSRTGKIHNPRTEYPVNYQWTTSWYRRWELLVDLSRQNSQRRNALCGLHDLRMPVSPPTMPLSAPYTADRQEKEICNAGLDLAQN